MIYIVFSGDQETKPKPHLPTNKYSSAVAKYEKLKLKHYFCAIVKSEKVNSEYQSTILKISEGGEEQEVKEMTLPNFKAE